MFVLYYMQAIGPPSSSLSIFFQGTFIYYNIFFNVYGPFKINIKQYIYANVSEILDKNRRFFVIVQGQRLVIQTE